MIALMFTESSNQNSNLLLNKPMSDVPATICIKIYTSITASSYTLNTTSISY